MKQNLKNLDRNYAKYVGDCCNQVKTFLETHPDAMIEYLRKDNHQRQRWGVVVAWPDYETKQVMFGWSKCHSRDLVRSRFVNEVGLAKAISRAVPINEVTVPDTKTFAALQSLVERMKARVARRQSWRERFQQA